jgi:hypothetical protein
MEPSKTLLSIEALRLKLGHFGAWPLNVNGRSVAARGCPQQPSPHSLGMVPGAVGHNDPEDHAAS